MLLPPSFKKEVGPTYSVISVGVVRGFENLGDRIIAKNLKAKDGNKYGVGRYIAVGLAHIF